MGAIFNKLPRNNILFSAFSTQFKLRLNVLVSSSGVTK